MEKYFEGRNESCAPQFLNKIKIEIVKQTRNGGVCMKKVLSVLGLLGILSLTLPANAAPPPPRGGHHGGQVVVSRSSYVNHPPMRGSYRYTQPPHRCNNGVWARRGYWGNPCYGNRLGWWDDCYYRPCPPPPPPAGFSTGVFIRF